MPAEQNLIKVENLARVREVEFVEMFSDSVTKLMEILGITRMIPKQAGTVLKAYTATGELEDGNVPEGEIIPLSLYKVEPVEYKELKLEKYRKATSAEAIINRGYDQAVTMTTDKMLKDAQKGIRKELLDFMATGTGAASGDTFQMALSKTRGELSKLFEDDAIEAVFFVNTDDAHEYLGSAQIVTQTAFGMEYIEGFLGLGTVFITSLVPKGKIYATARENIVLYYLPVNGADLDEAFSFTSDATGLIGIHNEPVYSNMTAETVMTYAISVFAERIDGVVVGTISGE